MVSFEGPADSQSVPTVHVFAMLLKNSFNVPKLFAFILFRELSKILRMINISG